MKKVFFFLLILSSSLLCADGAAPSLPAEGRTFKEPSRVMKPKEPSLHFNNRPLAKINGKTISLIDVINKMDLALFDYNPEFLNSTVARYKFYIQSWKQTLEDMINTEMILLEGEEKELKATDGEIREAMLERFGPSIIASLEMIRLTYEDAREMIRKELIVEQLIGVKVHTKAMQAVTPQVIRKGYEEYLAKHLSEEKWTYDVLSIRGKHKEGCEKIGQMAYTLLHNHEKGLEEVAKELQEEGIQVTLAADLTSDRKSLSKDHQEILKTLTPNSFSKPLTQVSRFDQNTVVRVFHLKSHQTPPPASFEELYEKIRHSLLNVKFSEEKKLYMQALTKRFGFDQHDPRLPLPENYTPFVLY